jgi:predicted metalloendopeptidase
VFTIAILNNLDESTNPCDDFYQYSCGGFLKKAHLPDGLDQIGGDTISQESIQNSLKEIFENEELMPNYSKVTISLLYLFQLGLICLFNVIDRMFLFMYL